MAWITKKIAKCDKCGHEWLVRTEGFTPSHCSNNQCKTRQWNASEKNKSK